MTPIPKRERLVWELSRQKQRNRWLYYEARKGTGFDRSETGRKALAKELRQ